MALSLARFGLWMYRHMGGVCYVREGSRGRWIRRRFKNGYIYLDWWPTPFRCYPSPTGQLINAHSKEMSGYGKQYGEYIWKYPTFIMSDWFNSEGDSHDV